MLHFAKWKIFAIVATCLMFCLLASPNFMSQPMRDKLPGWWAGHTVSLGLDLRGGSHLLLEVDFDAFLREQLGNLADETRVKLREGKVGYRNLSARDGKVMFELREDAGDAETVRKIIRDMDPSLKLEEPTPGQFEIIYDDNWKRSARQRVLEQSLQIVERRVNETGTKEPIIQRQGENRIVVQVPGLDNPEHLKNLLGRTAKMTFHMLDETANPEDVALGIVPAGTRLIPGDTKPGQPAYKYPVLSRVMLSGDLLVDASPTFDEQGRPAVSFRFNPAGARKFGEITSNNVGKPFAVVLDNKVVTAPRINQPILGGNGIITGNFSVQEATETATLLRAGALPAPLKVIEERSVGPSLGSDSIEAGKLASTIGIGMVVLFMILFYGLFGLFADIAMLINAVMTLALLSLFEATLTLPGIAGIVLTVGMAVDANVLIYERMREEVRNGKSSFAAVESGFKMAFGTIIDSHVTTLAAALILYYFGTGTVKGFAVTLAIGITCSLFTAVLVTRLMVATYMLKRKPKVLPL